MMATCVCDVLFVLGFTPPAPDFNVAARLFAADATPCCSVRFFLQVVGGSRAGQLKAQRRRANTTLKSGARGELCELNVRAGTPRTIRVRDLCAIFPPPTVLPSKIAGGARIHPTNRACFGRRRKHVPKQTRAQSPHSRWQPEGAGSIHISLAEPQPQQPRPGAAATNASRKPHNQHDADLCCWC